MEHVSSLNVTIETLQSAYNVVTDHNRETQRELSIMISEYDALMERYEALLTKQAEIQSEIQDVLDVTPIVDPITHDVQDTVTETHVETNVVVPPVMPVRPAVALPELIHDLPREVSATFGVTFPANPEEGDMFLRMDYIPSKLFKWSGNDWISVDKSGRDIYAYDTDYIRTLIRLVESGECDIDDLSDIEQAEMAKLLEQEKPNV